MRGSEDERERSGMVDSRAETSSLSDKTEFTETEDQGAMHQMGLCLDLALISSAPSDGT